MIVVYGEKEVGNLLCDELKSDEEILIQWHRKKPELMSVALGISLYEGFWDFYGEGSK